MEMRKEMGQPGQRLLTAAENVWIVSCSGYNANNSLGLSPENLRQYPVESD